MKKCESVRQECKSVDAEKKKKLPKLKDLGIPEEELLRMQQRLFAEARETQKQEAAPAAAAAAAAAAAVHPQPSASTSYQNNPQP